MSRSTCESHRDNQVAAATFKTPDGIPFFGWTEDGQYEQAALRAEKAAAEEAKRREEEVEEELCVEKMIEIDEEEEEEVVEEVKLDVVAKASVAIPPPARVTTRIFIKVTDSHNFSVVLLDLPLPVFDDDNTINTAAVVRPFKVFVDGEAAAPVPARTSSSLSAIGSDLLIASACEDDEDGLEEREVESLIFVTEDESERKENVNDGCVVTARSEEAEGSQRKVLKVTKTKTKTKKRSGGKSISMSVEAEGTKQSTRVRTRKDPGPPPLRLGKSDTESTAQRQRHTLSSVGNQIRPHYMIRSWGKLPQAEFSQEQNTSTAN